MNVLTTVNSALSARSFGGHDVISLFLCPDCVLAHATQFCHRVYLELVVGHIGTHGGMVCDSSLQARFRQNFDRSGHEMWNDSAQSRQTSANAGFDGAERLAEGFGGFALR